METGIRFVVVMSSISSLLLASGEMKQIDKALPSTIKAELLGCSMSIVESDSRSSQQSKIEFDLRDLDQTKIKQNKQFAYKVVDIVCQDERECISIKASQRDLNIKTASYILKTDNPKAVASNIITLIQECR